MFLMLGHFHLNTHRFKLLAFVLSLNFILPPFIDFPIVEMVKTLAIKMILVLVGAEFILAKRQKIIWYIVGVANLILAAGALVIDNIDNSVIAIEYLSFVLLVIFLFYHLMRQIAQMKEVNADGIIGAFSGYVLLGTIAFLTYLTISLFHDEMFSNLGEGLERLDRLFYYSFISMTTIGFGDIVPTHPYSQKLTIFFAIVGQFYLAVNVAILVSKYLKMKD